MSEEEKKIKLEIVKNAITSHKNFPRPGIVFKDLFSCMRDPEALQCLVELLRMKSKELKGRVDYVVGLDARGFLFGPLMAAEMGVGFVPVSLSILLEGSDFNDP